jgi:tetratricopeptide (TPR) repeat protein
MSQAAVTRAETLVELGRAPDAIDLLLRELAAEPDDTALLHALAQAQVDGDPEAALSTEWRVLELDPDHVGAHLTAALACYELRRFREGIKHGRRAVEQAPMSAAAHATLGQVLAFPGGYWREAQREASRAIELDPEEPAGYVAAGNAEAARAKPKKALKWYRKALELDPQCRSAQHNLAMVQHARNRLAPALGETSAILRFDPHDLEARRALDEYVYTSLVHLQWLATVALVAVAALRIG